MNWFQAQHPVRSREANHINRAPRKKQFARNLLRHLVFHERNERADHDRHGADAVLPTRLHNCQGEWVGGRGGAKEATRQKKQGKILGIRHRERALSSDHVDLRVQDSKGITDTPVRAWARATYG